MQTRVSASDREFVQVSAGLSRMLLGKMTGLSAARRLWVVSDGALEYLPFAALPAPGSTTLLVALQDRPPAFGLDDSRSTATAFRSACSARRRGVRRPRVPGRRRTRSSRALTNASSRVTFCTRPSIFRSSAAMPISPVCPGFGLRRRVKSRSSSRIAARRPWEALDFDASRSEANETRARPLMHSSTPAATDGPAGNAHRAGCGAFDAR